MGKTIPRLTQSQAAQIRTCNQALTKPLHRPSSVVKRLFTIPFSSSPNTKLSILARCSSFNPHWIQRNLNKTLSLGTARTRSNTPLICSLKDIALYKSAGGDFHFLKKTGYLANYTRARIPNANSASTDNLLIARMALYQSLTGKTPDQARESLLLLFSRYLAGYGPASIQDFSQWSGFPLKYCNQLSLLSSPLIFPVSIEGLKGSFFLHRRYQTGINHTAAPPSVCILPKFDPYLSGYRNKNVIFDMPVLWNSDRPKLNLTSIILFKGQVIARWQMRSIRKNIEFIVRPFWTLSQYQNTTLETEFKSIAYCLGAKQHAFRIKN